MAFSKLINMDAACNQLNVYVEHAMFIQSDVLEELEKADTEHIDQEKAEALCLTVRRVTVLSGIVFDYLRMMKKEAKQMDDFVQEEFNAQRQEKEAFT